METNGKLHTPIIIIGAGVTGLSVAQGLKKIGISCIVFEKKESLLPPGHRDWNLGTHWGYPYLQQLISEEANTNLQQVEVDPHVPIKEEDHLKFHNAATGELVAAAPTSYFHRLQRHKLRKLLAEGIDVRFNKGFESMEMKEKPDSGSAEGVLARFSDGTAVSGKLIIGADGTRSAVRHSLLGEEPSALRPLPWVSSWAQAKYPADQARYLRQWHNLLSCSVHPTGSFSTLGLHDIPDPENPEDWMFFFYLTWPLKEGEKLREFENAERVRHIKSIAKDWADPMKSAVGWLQDDHYVWHAQFMDWDPEAEGHRWDNRQGRVTLAGDAAHTMTWSRGQGLNHSLKDAVHLVEAIEQFVGKKGNEPNQKKAIDNYEAEMIPRAGLEVRTSSITTEAVHDWSRFMDSPIVKNGLKRN